VDETPMSDAEFRLWCIQTFQRWDRQYDQLLEVQLDLARSHNEHEAKMEQIRLEARMEQMRLTLSALVRSHGEHEAKMDLMRVTLDAIKDLLERERRN
jgi:hypothetical protein